MMLNIFFMCLFTLHISSSVKCLFTSFAHFLNRFFSTVEFWEFFYMFEILDLWQIRGLQILYIFSRSIDCLFILLVGSLIKQKFLFLLRFNLSCFPIMNHTFGEKLNISLPSPKPWRFSPCLFLHQYIFVRELLAVLMSTEISILDFQVKNYVNEYLDELVIVYIAGLFKTYF